MKKYDLKYLATIIGNLSGIPIRLFTNNKLYFFYSIINLKYDPFILYKEEILKLSDHIGYYVTSKYHYYGILNYKNNKLIIGPTSETPFQNNDLKDMALNLNIPFDEINVFINTMNEIITMPLDSITLMLCSINYMLNGEKKTIEDVNIKNIKQANYKKHFELERIEKDFESANNTTTIHNTIDLEKEIMQIVRKGNVEALQKWLKNAPAIRGGVLAKNLIRQQKNTFIVSATLISRAAIDGGLTVEDALSLSDVYIQQCELTNNINDLTNLQYRMILDFTERVKKIRYGNNPSELVINVTNYIQHHLTETITVNDISKYLYISRSNLSTRFKKETGINLNAFIMQEKINEAKSLLQYSNKSLNSISAYLSFSSQSHFSRAFKQYTSMTPKEYQEKCIMQYNVFDND